MFAKVASVAILIALVSLSVERVRQNDLRDAPPGYQVFRLGHISVETHDLRQTREFYRNVVGLLPSEEPTVEVLPSALKDARQAFSHAPSSVKDFLQETNPFMMAGLLGTLLSFHSFGQVHHDFVLVYETDTSWKPVTVDASAREYPKMIAFRLREDQSLETFAEAIRSFGFPTVEGATIWSDQSVSVTDPDGRLITFYKGSGEEATETPSGCEPFIHNCTMETPLFAGKDLALHVSDLSRAEEWYRDVVGLRRSTTRASTDDVVFLCGLSELSSLALIRTRDGAEHTPLKRGHNHVAFELLPPPGTPVTPQSVIGACQNFNARQAGTGALFQHILFGEAGYLFGPVAMRFAKSLFSTIGFDLSDNTWTPLLYGPILHNPVPSPVVPDLPIDNFFGGNYAQYVLDPDGHTVEIFCGMDPFDPTMTQRFKPGGAEDL